MVCSELQPGAVTQRLNQPSAVVLVDELGNQSASLVNRLKAMNIKNLLPQVPVKAFKDAAALWTSDKGR